MMEGRYEVDCYQQHESRRGHAQIKRKVSAEGWFGKIPRIKSSESICRVRAGGRAVGVN